MSQILKTLYNNLSEPALIFDYKNSLLNQNAAFKKVFGKIEEANWQEALKRLEYKFYFEICVLKSEDLTTCTPIASAIKSPYDYTTYCVYQKTENEFLHFIIKAVKVHSLKVIYFYEITKDLRLRALEDENQKLKIQNQEFSSTNTKAQNQAVKMALLNRITTSIRETIDIKSLITTSLSELSIIFGAHRLYFLKKTDGKFEIEDIFPARARKENFKFDNKTMVELKKGSNITNVTLVGKTPFTRIVMPILNRGALIAVIVIFTPQKTVSEIEKELLTSISLQISSAMLQVNLFEQIREKKEELENTIKELKETQLQLINSEKMASLGQLIASVAHEINTPLASISANNEIMQKLFEDSINKELLEEINEIDEMAIKRISNIVKSLKRFVRLDEEIQQQADINQELDLTLDLLKHKTKDRINIIKRYANLPFVNCYPNMLNQVFLNILMNAIQAIEGSKKQGKIRIRTVVRNKMLTVVIEDNGVGIDKENEEKIFHAGYTTKKAGEGTGLGLAISKKIVEKHNGTISFRTRKNRGTEFTVKIPVC